jgi:hypothetical protein
MHGDIAVFIKRNLDTILVGQIVPAITEVEVGCRRKDQFSITQVTGSRTVHYGYHWKQSAQLFSVEPWRNSDVRCKIPKIACRTG